MRSYNLDFILYCLAAIIVLTFPQFGSANSEAHNPALECPEIHIEALDGRYELEVTPTGITGSKTTLRFLWYGNERSPQLSLQSGLFNRVIGDIFRFFREHFNDISFLQEINIVQTNLGNGIGALYCRSYQLEPAIAVTMFFSPKTLESTNEFTRLIAHELIHHWFLREGKNATKWIEEGVAYLVEYLVTGRLSGGLVIQYMNHPGASLTKLDLAGPMRQMGHAQLLFVYLYEKLGDDFLSRLLSSPMTSIESVADAIPPNNPYGWKSFKDAFRDFQIAKYLNRQDYWANNETERNRYFLFPTTIPATASTVNATEWSGIEYRNHEQLVNAPPLAYEYEDLAVIDDPSQPITLRHIDRRAAPQVNERYIRIIY